MKTTPLALTLTAAVLGVLTLGGTAGAGTNQLPDNMVEGQTYTIQVDAGVNLADHRTDNMAWVESDASDVQPLGYAFYSDGSRSITFTLLPHVDCSNHQLDLVRGELLQQVDRGSRNRYNRTPYGGENRLVDAAYVAAADDCGTPDTTTTTAADLPPASVPPTTITVERTTPTPAPTTTTVFVSADDPLTPAPPTTITPYAAAPTLPNTGLNPVVRNLVRIAVPILSVTGFLCMYLAANLPSRRRNRKENAQ